MEVNMEHSDVRGVVKSNTDDLPLVLTPADIAAILGISRNKTYEVLHSNSFPVFQIGKQYRVHRDKFLTWLDTAEGTTVA